jgi:hypothetical protein
MSMSAFPHGTTAAAIASGPTVSPRADGDINVNADSPGPVTCYQGCEFASDGNEYEVLATTGGRTNSTVWLDSGSASDVWVEFVRTAGATAWDSHSSSTRYQLNVDRNFNLSITRFPEGSSVKTITGYFRMHDAASGGNVLWTGSTVEWKATATVLGGAGP